MTKNKPQEKDKEKVFFYTWTKRFGWRVNGYIKEDKGGKTNSTLWNSRQSVNH